MSRRKYERKLYLLSALGGVDDKDGESDDSGDDGGRDDGDGGDDGPDDGMSDGAASHATCGSKKSKAGTLHSDPTRIKKSTRAGLSKLTAGRPHLEVVKTRKEHEAPRNATRTTLDLRLS